MDTRHWQPKQYMTSNIQSHGYQTLATETVHDQQHTVPRLPDTGNRNSTRPATYSPTVTRHWQPKQYTTSNIQSHGYQTLATETVHDQQHTVPRLPNTGNRNSTRPATYSPTVTRHWQPKQYTTSNIQSHGYQTLETETVHHQQHTVTRLPDTGNRNSTRPATYSHQTLATETVHDQQHTVPRLPDTGNRNSTPPATYSYTVTRHWQPKQYMTSNIQLHGYQTLATETVHHQQHTVTWLPDTGNRNSTPPATYSYTVTRHWKPKQITGFDPVTLVSYQSFPVTLQ